MAKPEPEDFSQLLADLRAAQRLLIKQIRELEGVVHGVAALPARWRAKVDRDPLSLQRGGRAFARATLDCVDELEALLKRKAVPNTRVADIMRGMGVVGGLLHRKRSDVVVAISTDVRVALEVTQLVIAAAERDTERAFGETPDLTPAESNRSYAALLDAVEAAYDRRPRA